MEELVFSVSDFVAVFNQTLSFAYPSVVIEGELDSLRISRGQWIYFNLKDNNSSVKFFGNVGQMPGPLEDGIVLKVRGVPFLHPQFGFSINVQFMQPTGEGSLKRAAQLLEAKLTKEGLFDESRKRIIPVPPKKISLITSVGSAAYHDFIKIVSDRWVGLEIEVQDTVVQGDNAPVQIANAISSFNLHNEPADVIVIIRGGGSQDDLAAFSSEIVTRAVAASRIPTLVAIGHEVDVSLAEKAADLRGSTPTHAAELLTLDKKQILRSLAQLKIGLIDMLFNRLTEYEKRVEVYRTGLEANWTSYVGMLEDRLLRQKNLSELLSPHNALKRGYAVMREDNKIITSGKSLKIAQEINIELNDAEILAVVKKVKIK